MVKGFECIVIDEISRGSKSPSPAFKSKDGALRFALGYSALGHEVHVLQRSKGNVISMFRDGKKIG